MEWVTQMNGDESPPVDSQPAEAMPSGQVPPQIQQIIEAHKAGQGGVMLWCQNPQLAQVLVKEYGPSGLIIQHDEAQHGPLGHMGKGQPDATT
jgi:hypothetical protein